MSARFAAVTWSQAVHAEGRPDPVEGSADPFDDVSTPLSRAAARVGCTEGQLWSLALGLVAATVLLVGGLPDIVWRPEHSSAATAFSPPQPQPATSARPAAGIAPPVASPAPTAPASLPPPRVPAQPPLGAATSDPSGDTTTEPEPSVDAPVPAAEPATALRVADGGYASSTAGTPVASSGVPTGGLAIAVRAGQIDKVSFVILVGGADMLELGVDPTPGANVLEPFAGLQLCPVLEAGWRVGDGDTSLVDAPAYDCGAAVPGVRAATGDRWTFDLSAFEATRDAGFAIVPDVAASPSFQVVLQRAAPEEEP
jgi:hypothetical protein